MVTGKNPSEKVCNFICECCHFKCSKNSEYIKHLLTAKHIGNASGNSKKSDTFSCKFCSKIYKSRKGLWGHNKTCNSMLEESNIEDSVQNPQEDVKVLTSLVMELMKSNTELQKQLVDVCKNTSTINSHNNHSNNKTFNLQFFLNEQCKDAMNISDFANSFDLQLSDLESVGDLGYVEGITKLMVDKLNSMDIYKRPIHCSDAKREILYVKDDNKWEREERNNPKLRYAIKTISFRNMKLAALWSDTYPESKDCDSYVNERYMKLIKESTGGSGEIIDNENKIIRRIAKEIVIDKN
jgi:hypothetical protein